MFISVSDAAKKWKISDRMVRRYCIQGRIQGAYQEDEVWFVPEDAEKPERKVPDIQENPTPKPQPPLVKKLRQQKTKKMYHGLYDYVQTNLTYSNGRMASNRLMLTQITEIFETDKVKTGFEPIKVDDLIEATDHMLCVDHIIDTATQALTQTYIMNYKEMPPFAPVLMESTRAIGYSLEAAVADIIDNSIAAEASAVDIKFSPYELSPYVSILDNGHGMDSEQIDEAMRYGSQSSLEVRGERDLGRFGLGLKTASLAD